MSNSLAIAAVTATLRGLLDAHINADPLVDPSSDPALAGTIVTARSLDEASSQNHARQINLFLYQTHITAAWRNMEMPRQARPGETSHPPLPLTLYYLLTIYVRDDDQDADFLGHRLLGRAMSILHDHPLLDEAEIRNALPGNDLHAQMERVRITPQPQNLDDISKLWTIFQTPYRLSVVYEVSLLLIESTRLGRTPLPVLRRGEHDQGTTSQPDLMSPYPAVTAVSPPNKQPAARLNDLLALTGYHLTGTAMTIRLHHSRLGNSVLVMPEPGNTDTAVNVKIPDLPGDLPAGFYTLAVELTRPGETFSRRSNELPFALAPEIVPPLTAVRQDNTVTITVTVRPTVQQEQRVALLLGHHELLAQPHPAATNSLTFIAVDNPVGTFPAGTEMFVRLRVDGVDTFLINYQAESPQFDPNQKVTLP